MAPDVPRSAALSGLKRYVAREIFAALRKTNLDKPVAKELSVPLQDHPPLLRRLSPPVATLGGRRRMR